MEKIFLLNLYHYAICIFKWLVIVFSSIVGNVTRSYNLDHTAVMFNLSHAKKDSHLHTKRKLHAS